MIILFANQKGGCGKTTHCVHFANYLAEKKIELVVLDLDFQRSVYDIRSEDVAKYDNPPKYEVIKGNLGEVSKMFADFNSVDGGNLLIDLPGKIDDDALGAILKAADVIVCPFSYDRQTINSTGVFVQVIDFFKVKAKVFFIPNRINRSVKYENKEMIIDVLGKFGKITAEVYDRISIERLNTLELGNDVLDIVRPAYDLIINEGNIK